MNEVAFLIVGLLAGGAVAVCFYRSLNVAKMELAKVQEQVRGNDEQKRNLEEDRDAARSKLEEVQAENQEKGAQIAVLKTDLENEQNNATEKINLLKGAQENMKAEFKNLAQGILEEKSKNFSTHSQEQLKPLMENMKTFRESINRMHEKTTEERTALKTHIDNLRTDTSKVSTSADNLVRAFKGSGKTQGLWGEQVLLKLLERAGLKKDENYTVQEAHTAEDGKRQILDATIKLPDGKHLIIDAKVATIAYLEYVNAEDDDARSGALLRHLEAVNTHVKQLHEKNYSNIQGINSPDFVLMFMSPESAYILALQEDDTIFSRAYEKKIVITGATTLMPVLLAVAHLWRLESQQKNAEEIARQGGQLYDKIVGFNEDMEKLDRALGTARETYDKAKNKLIDGRGSIYLRAESLRELGVSAKKRLPQKVLAMEAEYDDEGKE